MKNRKNKIKKSIAIPLPVEKLVNDVCKKTGESFSAAVTRLLIERCQKEEV